MEKGRKHPEYNPGSLGYEIFENKTHEEKSSWEESETLVLRTGWGTGKWKLCLSQVSSSSQRLLPASRHHTVISGL